MSEAIRSPAALFITVQAGSGETSAGVVGEVILTTNFLDHSSPLCRLLSFPPLASSSNSRASYALLSPAALCIAHLWSLEISANSAFQPTSH